MVRPSQRLTTGAVVPCRWLCLVGLWVWLLASQQQTAEAVSGIYVNNQRLEKVKTDSLLVPKGELLTKANFTSGQSGPTISFLNPFWDRNRNHSPPSALYGDSATGASATPTTIQYADELSSIKNTLLNENLAYAGDYRPTMRPSTRPAMLSTATALPSISPTTIKRKLKKQHKRRKTIGTTRKPTAAPAAASVAIKRKTAELTPEMMTLLQRYYSFSCTLVPKQADHQSPTATRRTPPIRNLTTRHPMTSTTTTTTTTTTASTTTTNASKPTRRRTKPTVYVNPPVIRRLGGMLESVYNFMENALTSTEIRASDEEDRGAAKKVVKRNTGSAPERAGGTVVSPAETRTAYGSSAGSSGEEAGGWKRFTGSDRVTIAGLPALVSSTADGNKNKMTTNIQVTSEYTAATPATVPVKKPNHSDDDDDSSESDESTDYYGGFDDAGFDDDDDDDDDDEDEDDEGGDEDGEQEDEPIQPNRRRRRRPVAHNDKDYDGGDDLTTSSETGERPVPFRKRRRRKPTQTTTSGSYEDSEDRSYYEDDDDDDDDDDEEEEEDDVEYSAKDNEDDDDDGGDDDIEDPPEGSSFFSGMFATFSRFVRSLGFGGTFRDEEDRRGRSTTPRVLAVRRRRPTRSTSGEFKREDDDDHHHDHHLRATSTTASWLPYLPPAYLFNELEDDDPVDPDGPEAVGGAEPPTPTSWFDLMMPWDFFNPWGSETEAAPASPTAPTEPATAVAAEEEEEEEEEEPAPGEGSSASWSLLGQWFGGTTSTRAPPTTSSGPAPEQLLSVLTQYVAAAAQVASTTTAKPQASNRRRSYAGYQLWRVTGLQSAEQLQSLTDYRRSPAGLELQWWIGPSLAGPTDVLVPPAGPGQSNFREYLRDDGMGYDVTIRNLGRAIAYENPRQTRRDRIETELLHGHPLTWYRYHRYTDIVKFLGALHRHHAHRVQLLHIGRSYEGRPLTVVRVSFAQPAMARAHAQGDPGVPGGRLRPRKRPRKRPAIFIEAGAQGREWIGPAVATWLLNRLVEIPPASPAANGTPEVQDSVQSYDWYVLPVLNPDGYEYSHEHDRMWSKSRANSSDSEQPESVLSSALSWWQGAGGAPDGARCLGVNLDRNWGHRWGQEAGGASRSECSEDYAGPAPFSEPETRAVRDFLMRGGRSRNLRLYFSLHSYGQTLSYPTTQDEEEQEHTGQTAGREDEDVHEMASVGLDALRGSGSEQQYRLLGTESASGTAVEYARYVAGIRYAYTLRLPDTGTHGFLLPPSNIVSTGRDLFELIKGMIEYN